MRDSFVGRRMRPGIADYLRIAGRHWLTMVGTTVAALAVATLWLDLSPALYRSTVTLFFSATSPANSGDAYEGNVLASERVPSYAELASHEVFAHQVIDTLHLRMDAETLSHRVEATLHTDTVLLDLRVSDTDPERARLLTQTMAEHITELVARLEKPGPSDVAPIKATIIEQASLPRNPYSPQPTRALTLAAALGIMLGFGIVILRELLDKTVRTEEHVEQVSGVGVIARVPYDARAKQEPVVTATAPQRARVEAFRVLRTNLHFLDLDLEHEHGIFVVTSCDRGEGRTTTAANLALAMAEAGQDVLLLDADLRRPTVARLLELESPVGLATVLADHVPIGEATQVYAPMPKLSVLAGSEVPPNPSELLQSAEMTAVLAAARDKYDAVVIDTPPLLPVTDAALLAAQADGTLVVLRYGRTTAEQLHQSMTRLGAVGGRCVGVVLNMVPRRRLFGESPGNQSVTRSADVPQHSASSGAAPGATRVGDVEPDDAQTNDSRPGARRRLTSDGRG